MSGHSHWKTTKRTKESEDKKRGLIFSKLSRVISLSAKEKGANPETNPELRMAIEEAKRFNMPKENIEKSIKRGSGELKGAALEEFLMEAYGPGGIAIIIKGITDNKNRSLSEIKQILFQNSGKIANKGSVEWMFEKKGCLIINLKTQTPVPKKEDLELRVVESGAEDFYWNINDVLEVYTKIKDLEKIKKNLENQNFKPESSSLAWIAKNLIDLDKKNKEKAQKLFEDLDKNSAVQEIYPNFKF